MKQPQFLLIALTLVSCNTTKTTLTLDEVFSNRFEHKMISSGNNFPDFNVKKDSLDLFLVALSQDIDVKQFQDKAGWTDKKLNDNGTFLESKNWLIKDEVLRPTIFVATDAQGMSLFEYAMPIALEISGSIQENLSSLKKLYSTTEVSKMHSFNDFSFFILSNVLLDNWQINNVEREFLMTKERPERHRKHYYFAIMENVTYPREGFGIYGNQYKRLNNSSTLSIYGNNRNVAAQKLKENKVFLDSIVKNVPKLSQLDYIKMDSLAGYFKPKLLKILTKNSKYIKTVFEKTGYNKSISFNEFFIWWYHFIYTSATNMLSDSGVLTLPDDGNFYYTFEH